MPTSLLIISRQAPWSGTGPREALDIALAGGAYDLPVGMLFLDDGVLQLALHQHAAALQQKDLTANLSALNLFGVEDLFACGRSLAERGVAPTELSVEPVTVLQSEQIAALIDRYDQVITI